MVAYRLPVRGFAAPRACLCHCQGVLRTSYARMLHGHAQRRLATETNQLTGVLSASALACYAESSVWFAAVRALLSG